MENNESFESQEAQNHLAPNNVSVRRLEMISQHIAPEETANDGKNDLNDFMAVFHVLAADIQKELPSMGLPPFARDWIKRLVNVNVQGGKMNRGLTVIHALQELKEDKKLTRSQIFQAHVLGWCVEWLQAFFLVADDIMDGSITRRGQPCWYRQPHPLGDGKKDTIGNIAINDSFILEALIYKILNRHFSSEPFYADLLDLFHETSYQTELGQLLDLTSNLPGGKVDLSLFTLDTYKLIVKYKTAYYSFYLPVALALLLAGVRSKPTFQIAEEILLPMGEYFQIQDDFLDCYGDPKVIGKIGRDIEDNKCSWLVVQALRLATPEQRKILENHYGRDNASDVAKIKALYEQLNMKKVFQTYEEESYNQLKKMIDSVHSIPKGVFESLLAKIYKRKL